MIKLLLALSLIATTAYSQSEKKLPAIIIKNLDGNEIDVSKISNDGKPVVISFWATYCGPCILELNNISEKYSSWKKNTGVKIIAISIDSERQLGRVAPFVEKKGWTFEILSDAKNELKNKLGIPSIPYTILLDGEGNIVWSHKDYTIGDEEELYKKIVEIK